jgi:hypothetical protein
VSAPPSYTGTPAKAGAQLRIMADIHTARYWCARNRHPPLQSFRRPYDFEGPVIASARPFDAACGVTGKDSPGSTVPRTQRPKVCGTVDAATSPA